MNVSAVIIAVVLVCALLGATGQVFFKMASKKFSFAPSEIIKNYYFWIGAGLYGLSAMLFVWSLKHGDLSLLYPVIATSYIWVTILSVVFLNESFPVWKWLGVGMIIVGIAVIVR